MPAGIERATVIDKVQRLGADDWFLRHCNAAHARNTIVGDSIASV